jgi:DNA primase
MALSKHDIAEYYSDPHVREAILSQVQNRPLLAVMDRGDNNLIMRRNAADGKPIKILDAKGDTSNPQDLAWYTDRRYSEFHPSIGRNTRTAWVDIDPGKDVSFDETKRVTQQVAQALGTVPEISDTRITYSGGRGFHVRGDLHRKMPTDKVRAIVEATLKPLAKGPLVLKPPKPNQIRLDTSTFHNMGALRAEYSLNSETGRVAVPLTERELRNFEPHHADVARILKEKEFAPGVPRSRRMYALPAKGTGQTWTLVIQEHHADKAGLHWDLRLVDPGTSYAHSWAIPKAKLPAAGEKLLAVRTPTHTSHYAMNFGAAGPQQIGKGYGKGTVQIVVKEPILVEKVTDDTVKFKRESSNESYTIFRTHGDKWLLQRGTSMEKSAYQLGYEAAFQKMGLDIAGVSAENEPSRDTEAVQDLVGAMQKMVAPGPRRDSDNSTEGQTASEQRLNSPVSWSTAVSAMGQGLHYDTFRGRSNG